MDKPKSQNKLEYPVKQKIGLLTTNKTEAVTRISRVHG